MDDTLSTSFAHFRVPPDGRLWNGDTLKFQSRAREEFPEPLALPRIRVQRRRPRKLDQIFARSSPYNTREKRVRPFSRAPIGCACHVGAPCIVSDLQNVNNPSKSTESFEFRKSRYPCRRYRRVPQTHTTFSGLSNREQLGATALRATRGVRRGELRAGDRLASSRGLVRGDLGSSSQLQYKRLAAAATLCAILVIPDSRHFPLKMSPRGSRGALAARRFRCHGGRRRHAPRGTPNDAYMPRGRGWLPFPAPSPFPPVHDARFANPTTKQSARFQLYGPDAITTAIVCGFQRVCKIPRRPPVTT